MTKEGLIERLRERLELAKENGDELFKTLRVGMENYFFGQADAYKIAIQLSQDMHKEKLLEMLNLLHDLEENVKDPSSYPCFQYVCGRKDGLAMAIMMVETLDGWRI